VVGVVGGYQRVGGGRGLLQSVDAHGDGNAILALMHSSYS
jgi:hypothetical protein